MSFISITFILYVALINLIFYCCPLKGRNITLLLASMVYFWFASGYGILYLLWGLFLSYAFGIAKEKQIRLAEYKIGLWVTIIALLLPLFFLKYIDISTLWIPVGISFYTLSLVSYVVDVFYEKYKPEKNFTDFFLFAAFFPHIVQGPIARYNKLVNYIKEKHIFDYQNFTFGWQLILWGYFLKFVIADKAGIMVNTVYGNYTELNGVYIVFAAFLYSFQLYADFFGCVNIAMGVAQTFGIKLQTNFVQPYFAVSVREFWHRWHITLSNWLRDYVYIPLGGNRKGICRQCLNILLVFTISGIWHGAGLTFLCWGVLHGLYQIVEILIERRVKLNIKTGLGVQCIKTLWTFLLVTFAWMLFRCESLPHFVDLLKYMFSCFNPEAILNGDAYYKMGLSRIETLPLIAGILALGVVDICHEKNIRIRPQIASLPGVLRWSIYLATIMFVLIFGTYGPAYSANQFIYGQF